MPGGDEEAGQQQGLFRPRSRRRGRRLERRVPVLPVQRDVPDDPTVLLGDPRRHLGVGGPEAGHLLVRQVERVAVGRVHLRQEVDAGGLVVSSSRADEHGRTPGGP